MLEVQRIRKHYDGQLLLDDISLQVAADETVCLLGPSGGGKSTLLRIIAGLEESESGSIMWDGAIINAMPAHERRFGLMFQDYALFPHMSVSQNVAFGLRMQHVAQEDIRRQVDEAMAMVNMNSFADRRVTELSGGEQQRVALARALVARPQLLMLDEPLGALDRALRESLGHELRRLLDGMDIPVIYVTHDQAEAFAIADRLLILHAGSILQAGAPAEVYHQPASPWLAAFLGQDNQVEGTVMESEPLRVQTACGLLVCRSSAQTFKPGQPVTLVLAPTAASIAASEEEGEGVMRARVRRVRFQGIGFMIDFLAGDGQDLSFFFDRPLPTGEDVNLRLNQEMLLCYGK